MVVFRGSFREGSNEAKLCMLPQEMCNYTVLSIFERTMWTS